MDNQNKEYADALDALDGLTGGGSIAASKPTVVFENERYAVVVTKYALPATSHHAQHTHGYAVVNKETEVHEVLTPQLPDAIAAAEQLDISMEAETWKWIRINFQTEQIMAEAKTDEGQDVPH